jgi:hypothetical protein
MKKVIVIVSSIILLSSTLCAQSEATLTLIKAAKTKNYNLAIAAMAKNADINYQDADGNAPLHYAADINYGNDNTQTERKKFVQTVLIIKELLSKEHINVTLVNNAGFLPIDNALKSCSAEPKLFNAKMYKKLMAGLNDKDIITNIIKNLGDLNKAYKPSVDWLLSFSAVKEDQASTIAEATKGPISSMEIQLAEEMLLGSTTPTPENKTYALSIIYKYFINACENGEKNKAKVATMYLKLYTDDLTPEQENKILAFNTYGISYVEAPDAFDADKFKAIAKKYLGPNTLKEDLGAYELARMVAKKFVLDVNRAYESSGLKQLFNSKIDQSILSKNAISEIYDIKTLFNKETLEMLYSSSGLIAYLQQDLGPKRTKDSKGQELPETVKEVQNKARSTSYVAIMMINELTKAFASKYIARDLKIELKVQTIDLLVKEEKERDPIFRDLFNEVKNGGEDLMREATKLDRVFE